MLYLCDAEGRRWQGPIHFHFQIKQFCLPASRCSPPQPVCLFALVHRSDITDVVFCMASGRLDTLICFDPDDAMLDQIFILSLLFNQCVYYGQGQSKCSIGILPTEVGLEAGYNLLPVMEDKNLLAMYTQYLYTGHTASSDSGKQLRHPRS